MRGNVKINIKVKVKIKLKVCVKIKIQLPQHLSIAIKCAQKVTPKKGIPNIIFSN